MRIGLTYDLAADWAGEGLTPEDLAEFDAETTVAAIEAALRRQGHAVERIGRAQALMPRLIAGGRWDLVFNICEGLRGPGREALVPALLDAHAIPYTFSDPLVLALCLHKGHTKRVVRDADVPTAPFLVLERPEDARSSALPLPAFLKPVAEGTGKGIGPASLCGTAADAEREAARLLARYAQPVLAEAYLPGREFTVGVLGTGAESHVIGVMEVLTAETYGFETKKAYEGRVSYRLADDGEARAAERAALAAWRCLGCRDLGRVDLRSDADARPQFLEANPLAGLHPVDSDLTILAGLAGHSHAWLIDQTMRGACLRLGLPWP
jgi:D-alanine-D-alanine ligase